MAHEGSSDAIEISQVFEQIARSLAKVQDLDETLSEIVDLAVDNLEACEYAGISLVDGRRITSPASSNDIPRTVDAIQSEVAEGPCLDAISEHRLFRTGDLTAEHRWPNFASRAHDQTGVTSILGIRLFIDGDTMGALNLYSTARDAFDDDDDVALASVFAAHAAVALSSARREDQLERKAETRDSIGQAKGILMARGDVDEVQAFDMLRRASQRLNIKLTEVADRVLHPDEADGPSV